MTRTDSIKYSVLLIKSNKFTSFKYVHIKCKFLPFLCQLILCRWIGSQICFLTLFFLGNYFSITSQSSGSGISTQRLLQIYLNNKPVMLLKVSLKVSGLNTSCGMTITSNINAVMKKFRRNSSLMNRKYDTMAEPKLPTCGNEKYSLKTQGNDIRVGPTIEI